MAKITLYHGSGQETTPFTMYFAADRKVAEQFSLGLRDTGEYNEESYIYATEIDTDDVAIEEDFEVFDCLAYVNPRLDGYGCRAVYNPGSGWYSVCDPELRLIDHYKNVL